MTPPPGPPPSFFVRPVVIGSDPHGHHTHAMSHGSLVAFYIIMGIAITTQLVLYGWLIVTALRARKEDG